MATSRALNFAILLMIGLSFLSQWNIQPAQAGIILTIDDNVSHPLPTTKNVRLFMLERHKLSFLRGLMLLTKSTLSIPLAHTQY